MHQQGFEVAERQRDTTGGHHRPSLAADTPLHRLAAYVLVRTGTWLIEHGARMVPREHPARVFHESACRYRKDRIGGVPRWGFVAMSPLPAHVTMLWRCAFALLVVTMVGELFAGIPIDPFGIPDPFTPLVTYLDAPQPCLDKGPCIGGEPLPWAG